jgi:hypothetical protein
MSVVYNPKSVTNGIACFLDAGNLKSYVGSGTTWNDLNGNISGTLTSGPTFSSLNKGSIVFDGINDYVTFGTSYTSLDLSDKSFQCWIKKSSASNASIIDKDFDNGGANYGGWGFWIQSNNKLWWWNQGNLDLLDDGANTISNTTWTNVAVTYNNTTKSASFYINGVLNSTKTNASIVEKSSSSTALVVGAHRGATGFFFDGSIAIVMAYNRILTSTEILQNFNAHRGRFGI